MKGLIKDIGPDEIKKGFGEDKIRQDLIELARCLKGGEIGLKDWEALIKKNSISFH